MDIDPAVIKTAAPGVVGSLLAAARLKGAGRTQRVTALAGGIACSLWGVDLIAQLWPRMPAGVAGFLLGLFGMSLVSKVFELIEDLRPAALLRSVLEQRGWIAKADPAARSPAGAASRPAPLGAASSPAPLGGPELRPVRPPPMPAAADHRPASPPAGP